MGLLLRSIQTKSNSEKPATALDKQSIDPGEARPVADKAEWIASLGYKVDYFLKPSVYSRLPPSKTHLLNTAAFAGAQHLFQNFQRQIAGGGMSLVKTVTAAQVAAIG
jgi:hypothetical protein